LIWLQIEWKIDRVLETRLAGNKDGGAPANEIEREMAELYRSYAPGLLRYAFGLIHDASSAQDGLQETFLRYFVARSEGRKFSDARAWLFRVMRNHLLDTLKSASVKNEIAIDSIHDPADNYNDPERQCQRTEMARELTRMLAPRELECVRLRAEGLSYDEIAGVLHLQQGTVGATLARAHKKIRRAVGRKEAKEQSLLSGCARVPAESSYSSSF
jgi:RNA polymerase sigma factor (sigma-70 family)